MNKLVKWLIGTSVTVGVPAGGYYGLVHDVNEKKIDYDEAYVAENLVDDLLGNCLDYTRSEGKIALSITDKGVNDAIHNATKDNAAAAVVPQVYCEFNNGRYDFYIQLKQEGFLTFGTKIKISTTLEEKIRSDFDNKSCFIFTFRDVKIGKIGGVQNVAIPLIKNFITEEQIQQAIGEQAHFTVKLDKGEIIYPKDEFAKDIKNIMNSLGDTGGIPLAGLFQAFFDNDLVHLNTEQKNALRFDIDCTQFAENPEYIEAYDLKLNDDTKHGGLTLDKINDYVAKTLEANAGKNEMAQDLFSFFFLGYDSCPASLKEELKTLNFSLISEDFDCTKHKGFELEKTSLNQSAQSQIETLKTKGSEYFANEEGFNLINFTESDINSYLASSDIMGFNFVIDKEVTSDCDLKMWKTSYICIDNIYCNIYDEKTNFVVGLNLNGYETNIIIPTQLSADKSVANFATGKFELTYEMGNISFGNIQLDERTNGDIFQILASASGDAMKFSKEGNKYFITFDFSTAISSSIDSTLSTIFATTNFKFVTKGTTKEDNGTLSIVGKYAI